MGEVGLSSMEERLVKFGNPELDKRLGGIPIPSLNLIEGPNDSGKSILSQQIAYGALSSGFRVLFITTEGTTKGLISQMESLGWKITEYFLNGSFGVTPLHTSGMAWNTEISKYYLIALTNFVKRKVERFDVFIIDSLTHVVTHAQPNDVLDFFSKCRYVVDEKDKVFIVTLHPYALDQQLLIRVRGFCDGHFLLSIKTFGKGQALMLNVSKLKGATRTSSEIISFEASPAYGIKILPFTTAKG